MFAKMLGEVNKTTAKTEIGRKYLIFGRPCRFDECYE